MTATVGQGGFEVATERLGPVHVALAPQGSGAVTVALGVDNQAAAGLLGGHLAGPALVAACAAVVRNGLAFHERGMAPALPTPLAAPLAVIFGIVVAAALLPAVMTGLRWSGGAAAPKVSRLDPLAGLKRIASLQGVVELGKALVKAALLGGVGWWALRAPLAVAASPVGSAGQLGHALVRLLGGLAAALAVIAALDVPWQRSRWLAKLRMTRQEAKDEARESDGNPETRAAQRRLARAAARAAIAPAMAEATVVTVNPSEFAVALRYVPGRDAAPVIVARVAGNAEARPELFDAAAERVATLGSAWRQIG